MQHISQLYNFRDLLLMWTWREIKVRYKQSVIGGLWAILQPLSLMLVFTVVFSYLVRIPTGNLPYPIFAFAGLLPWLLLANSVAFAVPSLVNNLDLVTKIYFPREILPAGSVLAAVLDFALGLAVFFVLLPFYRIPLSWNILWLPLLLGLEIVLIFGLVLMMAALNVFYRDIRFVIPLLTQIWFYASPVIYPTPQLPPALYFLYHLNPMAGLVESFRRILLEGQGPAWPTLALSAAISIGLFFVGYGYFKRAEMTFADRI